MLKTFVEIDNLKIFARHGVLPEEAVTGNTFEVSVRLEYDFAEAAENDDLEKTLNYAELTEIVVEIMDRPRRLIETVAMDIKTAIHGRWPEVRSGRIKITKLYPPIPEPTPTASVIVEW